MAAKNTPWLMKTLNVAKKLRFDDGGSTFSGNAWYQDGGEYDDTNTMNSSGSYGYGYEMGGYVPDYQMAYGGGYYNPMMATGGERMPPEIARARFAAAGNLDQMDNYGYAYGGGAPQNYYGNQGKNYTFGNGGRVGQEMEVTPQEAEMLRQQGYQFEIL
jgi:hypothetical protein